MDLFSQISPSENANSILSTTAPLAERMRPQSLSEFIGQNHLLGPGKFLARFLSADVTKTNPSGKKLQSLPSLIFWGHPGTGKTTLAHLLAKTWQARFVRLSAVQSGVKELRKEIEEAEIHLRHYQQRTVIFIDEIHRFNKSQQDVLLPHVESGIITLLGATTENPSFELNAALLSRARVLRLEPLSHEDLHLLIHRALTDKQRGLGELQLELAKQAEEHLIEQAGGDGRKALTALEAAAFLAKSVEAETNAERNAEDNLKTSLKPNPELNHDFSRDLSPMKAWSHGQKSSAVMEYHLPHTITAEIMAQALQQQVLLYDKAGDEHYNVISTFIKSMRGSDPDAAVYWMVRMLEAGEDPLFIIRRMVIFAAEDIGCADPQALILANATKEAVHFVGLPEAVLPMSQLAIYLSTAPKSNSALTTYHKALAAVQKHGSLPVPIHLRDSHSSSDRALGYGKGYQYPHDFEGHYVAQQYLPKELDEEFSEESSKDLKENAFYQPSESGYEKQIKERLQTWREQAHKAKI